MSRSFTIIYQGIARSLISDIAISLPTREKDIIESCHKHDCKAIWDTGATNSAITERVAHALKLQPSGQTRVNTASGPTIQNTYEVNIFLPNTVYSSFITVTECKDLTKDENDGIDVLIGMDIICRGDFSITNFEGKTTLSFRMPSSHKIDYVEEHNRKLFKNIGRNDKCPCMSGKKFKHCHGIKAV